MTTRTSAIALAVLLVCGVAAVLAPAASALPGPILCTVGPDVECHVRVCPRPPVCIDETVTVPP